MERKIQVVHLPDGQGIDKAMLMAEIEKHYDKLAKRLHEEMFMEVRFKEFGKEGASGQVECKAHVKSARIQFNSTGLEWGAMLALKHALESLEKEVERAIDKKRR